MAIEMQRFGEKLHTLRTRRGISLKELAAALGHSAHGHLSELEAGKKIPTVKFVLSVARLFAVSTDQLLRDEIELQQVPVKPAAAEPVLAGIPLVDRPPTSNELEQLRLLLSTYQDGGGQQALPDGGTLPGWRDFERAVAITLGGVAQESKAIFDVLIQDQHRPKVAYGISCKMRRELRRVARDGRLTLELSNSAERFRRVLLANSYDKSNYAQHPAALGTLVIGLVESWQRAVSLEHGGNIDLSRSSYLNLQWDARSRTYQLFQVGLALPNPASLSWSWPSEKRLMAVDARGLVFDWYPDSGAQLKYYPLADTAIWKSPQFELEALNLTNEEIGIVAKAITYFPHLWPG